VSKESRQLIIPRISCLFIYFIYDSLILDASTYDSVAANGRMMMNNELKGKPFWLSLRHLLEMGESGSVVD
jgi:fucose 4-O-acetylase-like acetyltransferase